MKFEKWLVQRMVFIFTLLVIVNGQTDTCTGNSQVFSSLNASALPFDKSALHCSSVWSSYNYVLRYSQNSTNIWSFVLSATNRQSWIGIGFSSSGSMVGSSAIVGWVDQSGSGAVKQYYLGGQSTQAVNPDQGNLNIVNNYTTLIVEGSTIYLAFQLQFSTPLTVANILYAVGPQNSFPDSNYRLTEHQAKVATVFDFSTGASSQSSSTDNLRKSHGVLGLIGWGILLPLGVIIARHFRQWDPAWFYLHIGFQMAGFILGIAGISLGFKLSNRLSTDVDTHKAIGIIMLAIGALQVAALFIRPQKDSKIRKYWNWYHHWFGRILLILGIANIFYGIDLANAGSSWNIGYGIALGLLALSILLLEIKLFLSTPQKTTKIPPSTSPTFDNHI
ncbi:hypothetical protein SUGI_0398330 [Cryptomeria japonica]|nr:hypothetical protein SUGI_0398330 [Cryptomeria japonica]